MMSILGHKISKGEARGQRFPLRPWHLFLCSEPISVRSSRDVKVIQIWFRSDRSCIRRPVHLAKVPQLHDEPRYVEIRSRKENIEDSL